ncbi:MAG: lipoprotein [Hyphomicrobiaceae bacterium]
MTRHWKLGLAVGLAMGLAGCGVRGSLEQPVDAKVQTKDAATATAESGQGKPEGKAPKPHRDFILDGLLR